MTPKLKTELLKLALAMQKARRHERKQKALSKTPDKSRAQKDERKN